MPIRLTGLASGLDTDAIISALVSSYSYKTDKLKKAQTKLLWKQDAWKSLNSKIYSLYESAGNLRFSKAYNLKKTISSDTTKANVSASGDAVNGTQKLNVLKVAQAGYLTGGKLSDNVNTGTTLAELGYTGGDGKVNVTLGDGTKKEIAVSQGTTVSSFLTSLQNAGVNARYDDVNKRIFVSSKETGEKNDFTLTGANVDGASALSKLGLNIKDGATDATYQSYLKYSGSTDTEVTQKVNEAIQKYADAQKKYDTASAQNGNLSTAYGYAAAYTEMKDALKASGLSEDEQKKLTKLLSMTPAERVDSLMDKDGNVYAPKGEDKDGNAIYSSKDGNGGEVLVQQVTTYTGSDNKVYKQKDQNSYTDPDGKVYKATDEKDSAGNTYYKYTADDGSEMKVTISSKTEYYTVTESESGTGKYKFVGTDGKEYQQKDDDNTKYVGVGGKEYTLENGKLKDADGKEVDGKQEEIKEKVYNRKDLATPLQSDIKSASDILDSLKQKASALKDGDIEKLAKNIGIVNTYEKTEDTVLDKADEYSREKLINKIQNAYGNGADEMKKLVDSFGTEIAANKTKIESSEAIMKEHAVLSDLAAITDSSKKDQEVERFVKQVQSTKEIVDNADFNTDAKKVDGQDAEIRLNGIIYKGASNAFSINGLNITAQGVTGDGDDKAITITTQTDTQGIYDTIKEFLTQYNSLINEFTSLFNAPGSKGYEPLTSDEKDAMSETEIEQWEKKIKDSLLRRDDQLGGVMQAMTGAMSKGYTVNGKTLYLSSFGIKTLGSLNAAKNQQNAYHIDGDDEDPASKKNEDKLMAAIMNDPDSVVSFMQQLSTGLYNAVNDKMKSSQLSSAYTIYNDKEMAAEYSNYTSLIKKWEEKLKQQEEYYYKKFGAMESALTKLQSQTSSMSGLFGGM